MYFNIQLPLHKPQVQLIETKLRIILDGSSIITYIFTSANNNMPSSQDQEVTKLIINIIIYKQKEKQKGLKRYLVAHHYTQAIC